MRTSRAACIGLAMLVLFVGCSSPSGPSAAALPSATPAGVASSATRSPTGSNTPSAQASGATGNAATMFVLVDRANAGDQSHYKVAIVSVDGRLLKVLTPNQPSIEQSGTTDTAPPLVSISADRVYYLDGDTSVAYYSRDGTAGLATTLPGGPTKLASFAVSPDDARIAVGIFDYSNGGPTVSIAVQDLVGVGHQAAIYRSDSKAEWPVAWVHGDLILAVGSSQASLPTGASPFAVSNPYNATGGFQVVDPGDGHLLDTIPPQCGYGLLIDAGSPCAHANGGVGVRAWTGATTWYPNSAKASFGMREALAPNGTVAANSSIGAIGLYAGGGKIVDSITAIQGSAVSMGWVDSRHLVVRRTSDGTTGTATIVDPNAGTAVDVAVNCGSATAVVACTDLVMFGTL